jgi:hypothetical protein
MTTAEYWRLRGEPCFALYEETAMTGIRRAFLLREFRGLCSAGTAVNGGFLAWLRAFLGEPRHARCAAICAALSTTQVMALQ